MNLNINHSMTTINSGVDRSSLIDHTQSKSRGISFFRKTEPMKSTITGSEMSHIIIENMKMRIIQQKNLELKERISGKMEYTREFSFAKSRKDTMVQYMGHYDNDTFPETPDEDVIPWQCFTRDFGSVDLPFDDQI